MSTRPTIGISSKAQPAPIPTTLKYGTHAALPIRPNAPWPMKHMAAATRSTSKLILAEGMGLSAVQGTFHGGANRPSSSKSQHGRGLSPTAARHVERVARRSHGGDP